MIKTVSLSGVSLSVEDQGSGTPLLLVHGFPLNQTMWRFQQTALAANSRVISPDLRGFGQSTGKAEVLTMESFADDLAALLDAMQVSDPIVLCGLSMGGYVSFAFWRKYADRVKALILCNTRASADTPEAAAGRRTTANKVLQQGTDEVVSAMSGKLLSPATPNYETLKSELVAMMKSTPADTVSAALLGMAEREDSTSLLASIHVPTMVISGQEDAIVPAAEMRDMAKAIKSSTYLEIEKAGHMTPMEQPEKVNQTIKQFLETLP